MVVLLGVFGGLVAFGFMGLFLGPTLLALAYSLVNDWIAHDPSLPPKPVLVVEPVLPEEPGEAPR
ncbi:hypothetical protein D9M70_319180 [compost metagenome]